MTSLAILLASFGYCGYAPIVPGTVGSAGALLLYVALRWSGLVAFEVIVIALLFGAGLWAATLTARHVGRTDPGVVVIDEVVGMLITVAFLRVGITGALVGFVLFRVLDVVKPFPAAQSERLPGGLGIMVDDVLAGLYAHLLLRGFAWMWPAWILS
jgi:phosphatidylglycerophosphatase A